MADFAPEAQRPLAAQLPQHAAAVGAGEARRVTVALASRMRRLVDRGDADLARELVRWLLSHRYLGGRGLARQAPEQRPDLARRCDVIHRDFGERTRGHARHRCVVRILDDGDPAAVLHRPQPGGAVVERTREDDAYDAWPERERRGAEERIDRWAR